MNLKLAQEFAALLDEARFNEAALFLAEECKYRYEEGNYQGRNSIIELYRQNDLQSRTLFDEVLYSSSVAELPDGRVKITFTDKMRRGHRWHELHFNEVLTFNNHLISEIENIQIPGEFEKLRMFYHLRNQ